MTTTAQPPAGPEDEPGQQQLTDAHGEPLGEHHDEAREEVEETFDRTVEEGHRRLHRSWSALVATGLVGGIDIGTGVLAYLLVERATGSPLLAGLAFSIAFITLLLAGSELFTEGFLVPVAAVVAGRSSLMSLLKLWGVVMVMNLVGGWIVTWLVMQGYPDLTETAIKAGSHYVDYGHGVRALSLAILAGAAITLMTWMQHSTEDTVAKIMAAVAMGFLLAGAQLFHSILDSLMMFAALHTGEAPFGYLDWAGAFGTAVLGNVIGGLGLVTVLRLFQVPRRVLEQRASPASQEAGADRHAAHERRARKLGRR